MLNFSPGDLLKCYAQPWFWVNDSVDRADVSGRNELADELILIVSVVRNEIEIEYYRVLINDRVGYMPTSFFVFGLCQKLNDS